MEVVIVLLSLFLLFSLISGFCAYCDTKDEEKHREFLSERIGYKVLSLKEWCEERNINYSKYWDNKIVQAKYRSYILDIESKIKM